MYFKDVAIKHNVIVDGNFCFFYKVFYEEILFLLVHFNSFHMVGDHTE